MELNDGNACMLLFSPDYIPASCLGLLTLPACLSSVSLALALPSQWILKMLLFSMFSRKLQLCAYVHVCACELDIIFIY